MRAYPNPMLDFQFTIMRYAGSRLNADMHYLFATTAQLITIGSDYPEYSPATTLEQFMMLSEGIESHWIENITHENLEQWFYGYKVSVAA